MSKTDMPDTTVNVLNMDVTITQEIFTPETQERAGQRCYRWTATVGDADPVVIEDTQVSACKRRMTEALAPLVLAFQAKQRKGTKPTPTPPAPEPEDGE